MLNYILSENVPFNKILIMDQEFMLGKTEFRVIWHKNFLISR